MTPRFPRRSGRRSERAVPGWDALDLPWRDAEFCVVDLEASGLDLRRDEIVSYGAVIVRAGRVVVGSAVYGLMKPNGPVSPAAITVHALTTAELAAAPPPALGAAVLAELLQGRALVAHAAWVERALLTRLLGELDVALDGPVVDTAALARELGLARSGQDDAEPSLERLSRSLGLPVHTPHHALGDAMTTAGLFLLLANRLDAREPQTVRTLTQVSHRRALR